MADFSHLSRLPLSSFLRLVLAGGNLSDEFFDHLLSRIAPPLFDEKRMAALRAELCWFAPRVHRGRPQKGCRRGELAAAVRELRRDDVPAPLLNAIHQRLAMPAVRDRLREPRAAMMRREKEIRLSLMRGIYVNLIGVSLHGEEACHPLLAEKARMLRGSRRPHQDAVKLTQAIMRDDLRLYPPALGRMRNLILQKSPPFRETLNR